MVTPAHVEAFRKEMTAAGANFRIVTYPSAKHAFTNPKAESHGMDALAYKFDIVLRGRRSSLFENRLEGN